MNSRQYPPKALLWFVGVLWLTAVLAVIGICVWYGPSFVASLPNKIAPTTTHQMPQITPFQQMLLEHQPTGSLPFMAVSLSNATEGNFVYFDEEPIQLLPLTEISQVKEGNGVCISRSGCEWLCFVYKTEDGWHVVRQSIGGEHPVVRISSKLTHEKLAALLQNSIH